MVFVTTGLALAGALAMTLPIIIHLLFKNRRKTHEWAAMRLLLEAIRRHRRRSRIESLLLLTLRCLALLLLGSALAQPLIRNSPLSGIGSGLVVLIIDDGVVSGIRDEEGTPELERNITQAVELIDSLPSGTKMALVGTARSGAPIIDQPTINKERVRETLRSLEPSPTSSNLTAAMTSARTLIESSSESLPSTVVMIGSSRRGAFVASSSTLDFTPLERITWDDLEGVELLTNQPFTEPKSILAIESMSFRKSLSELSSSSTMIADIEVRRLGDVSQATKNTIRLTGTATDGTPPRGLSIPAGSDRSSLEFEFFVRTEDAATDGSTIIDAIIDEQILPNASKLSRVANTSDVIRVAMVDREDFLDAASVENVGSTQWMTRSLDPTQSGSISIDLLDPVSIDERRLESFDAVIVNRPDLLQSSGWDALDRFSKSGGFMLFTPPQDSIVHDWLDEFKSTFDPDLESNPEVITSSEPIGISSIQGETDILSMIDDELDDLSSPITVSRLIDIDNTNSRAETILAGNDDRPFLVVWDTNEERSGAIALLAASPSEQWTNLPVKPLMVPLMQELIRRGSSLKSESRSVLSGSDDEIPLVAARELVSTTGRSITLSKEGRPLEPLIQTGGWRVLNSSGRMISSLAVNPDIEACDPTLVTTERVQRWLENLGPWKVSDFKDIQERFSDDRNGSTLSILLLVLVLIIVFLETILNRRFSNARVMEVNTGTSEGARHA